MGRRNKGRQVNGILLVDKHQGESSNRIVQQIKRLYGAAKAGHTGALDPLATGMLPVCLGEATKFSQFLLDADKTYEVEAQLGIRTDTSDADGQVVETRDVKVSKTQLLDALESFRGEIQQVPSMFSALKYQGQPLYSYARKGIEVPREARDITVYSNDLLAFENDCLRLKIHCSKGTYIRTIIDDLGQLLGCGAHVRMLRRTQVADFPNQMHSVEYYQQHVEDINDETEKYSRLDELLLPMDTPVLSLKPIVLSQADAQCFLQGQQIRQRDSNYDCGTLCRVYSSSDNADKTFLGVAIIDESARIQVKRLVVYS
uniref:tRNA pseudouridine(55) synthase TruB n=1 Tax=Ningiella ruwaisensis TaxID=2364274 RepID=UPI0010A03176|nr:tRNA pseudouridine(55) synthase TruB [Ningiella ruwaisensis]